MNITIRKELPSDYFQIANITSLAFKNSTSLNEVALIDVLRHRAEFDPNLSLVACDEDKIVGHVLFSLCQMNLNGDLHSCAILAPIAVHPDYQKQGIGRLLIEEGHSRLESMDIPFSILLGHPSYYPKFGYQTHMFGDTAIHISKEHVKNIDITNITQRPVVQSDLPTLSKLWQQNFQHTNLSIQPSESLLNWRSCHPDIESVVIEQNGETLGYLRYNKKNPEQITTLLISSDKVKNLSLITYLFNRLPSHETVSLPLDGQSPYIKENLSIQYETKQQVWPAGMICIHDTKHQAIQNYIDDVKSDSTKAGMVTWPIEFEIA